MLIPMDIYIGQVHSGNAELLFVPNIGTQISINGVQLIVIAVCFVDTKIKICTRKLKDSDINYLEWVR